MSIILASNSPRRKELLRFIFQDFLVQPANIDESIPKDIPLELSAEYLAKLKAIKVAEEYPNDTIIGCDTIVLHNNIILGKPTSTNDCFNTLKSLSNSIHKVITGVCIVSNSRVTSFSETTEVSFYDLTDEEILNYISTGEPFDKAGSYGIQGYGSLLVKEIHGDFFNVVGLPISKLNRILKNMILN
ncbi:MAG: Maf family protein [Ruminococcus sp.]|nr:Maf family protein [Ruminococcus sp.]